MMNKSTAIRELAIETRDSGRIAVVGNEWCCCCRWRGRADAGSRQPTINPPRPPFEIDRPHCRARVPCGENVGVGAAVATEE